MENRTPGLRSETSVQEENERLRQKVSKLQAAAVSQPNHLTSALQSENDKLRAENEELRANLLAANSSNERFRFISDYSTILIALVDPEERYVFMNGLYQKWFGFEPENAIGKTILEVAGTFAREKVKNQIQSALLGNHVHFENPVTLLRGETKVIDLQFIPVWYPEHGANGFVILGYDITDRKFSESRILEIQDRLEFALKSAGMSSWHVDMRQNQPTASETKSRLGNEVLMTDGLESILKLVHPDDAEETLLALRESIQERKPFDQEYRQLQPDGTYRWISS
jgi:PAS domain S-box-containing protein